MVMGRQLMAESLPRHNRAELKLGVFKVEETLIDPSESQPTLHS
jgi:hypothetical protein